MQATANKIENKNGITSSDENKPFSPDELIFPSGNLDGPRIRYGYKIASMHFLVPDGVVSELIQKPEIFILPNSPSWIVGLINIRGNIIPVMSIEKYLKLKTNYKKMNLLVFNKSDNDNALAIVIEDLPILLEHSDITAEECNYPEVLNDYVKSGFSQNNIDWIEFNAQELFKNLASQDN